MLAPAAREQTFFCMWGKPHVRHILPFRRANHMPGLYYQAVPPVAGDRQQLGKPHVRRQHTSETIRQHIAATFGNILLPPAGNSLRQQTAAKRKQATYGSMKRFRGEESPRHPI
eukprot:gnl/TRDRNA2_/TRDRNA2_197160_c0_seq1.p2 gnl/TRDRNA2_/TRDRNA2_197160_c0~~gnl/TRDRNA2_/TRDRNA2_197160_c0_seq1.p2  ORF type:complete len:114 (-),score=9.00 gnl/TRDRNA2_/TRDRNA2_197160_c0_seq1:70-411(-)